MKFAYKGYWTNSKYSEEDGVYYGKIIGTSDLVLFESDSIDTFEREFIAAVDEYIEFCKQKKHS